jgi:hypothetical protein
MTQGGIVKHYIKILVFIFIPILLFSQDWTSDYYLSPGSTSGCNTRNIAVAPNGVVHIVWMEENENYSIIYYARSNDYGQTWPVFSQLSETERPSKYPAITISGNFIHVVWVDAERIDLYWGRIYYRRSSNSGESWQNTIPLDTIDNNNFPAIIADPITFGNVNIVWSTFGTTSAKWIETIHSSDQGSNWGNIRQIYYSENVDILRASIASEGITQGVYIAANAISYSTGWTKIIYSKSNDRGNNWQNAIVLENPDGEIRRLSIAAFYSNVHLIWSWYTPEYYHNLMHTMSSDGGTSWQTTSLHASVYEIEHPVITIDNANIVHMIWSEGTLLHSTYKCN